MTHQNELYWVERGLLMAAHPTKLASEANDPFVLAVRSVLDEIERIIQPEISAAADADDLDYRINELLFNDSLTRLLHRLAAYIRVSDLEDLGRSGSQGPPGLEVLVGRLVVRRVALIVRETGRVTASFLAWAARHKEASRGRATPTTSASYMMDPLLPPELKRALAGRDIGQIVYVGIANARRWALSSERVLELCERFIKHQSYWLEFLGDISGVLVDTDALPESRTNWAEAFERTQEANTAFDAAVQGLKDTDEKSHFYLDTENGADGSHEHR
jgi:hypothetical protein